MNSSRRTFIYQTLALLVAGAGLGAFLNACGGSSGTSSGTATAGNCQANGTTVTIGTNHGHGAPAITAADVIQGTESAYIVAAGTSSPSHSHTLTVTAALFTSLKSNTGVTMTTDADNTGHAHAITVNCA